MSGCKDYSNKFIVGYLGTHGLAHGLDFIVNSIKSIEDRDIHFLFIGDGAKKAELVKLAKELKLKNISFLDPISKDKMPMYLSLIDVALVPLKKSDTFKTVIPSKIFEAAAMQKPILLGVEGEAKRVVTTYNAGLAYKPENKIDFLHKLLRLKEDKELYKRLQLGCIKLAKDYDRKALAIKMLSELKEVTSKINTKVVRADRNLIIEYRA